MLPHQNPNSALMLLQYSAIINSKYELTKEIQQIVVKLAEYFCVFFYHTLAFQ